MSEQFIENVAETEKETQLGQLMQSLVDTLPPGTATLETTRNSSGLILVIKPLNEKSAAFGIHYDGCVDVFFGKFGTTFELPCESGLPRHADFGQVLTWAKAVGLAVISGKCRERAGLISIRGTVEVQGRPYTVSSFFHFRLLPKTVRYAAYYRESHALD